MSRRRIARATMSVLALAAFVFTTTEARAERVPMGIAAQATNQAKPAESKPAQSTTPTVQAAKQSPGQKKAVATAKRKPPVIRNGFFNVSAGYQAAANDFTNAWQFTKNVESTTATVTYPVAAGVQFDVAGGVRLWRDLLVGAAVSSYNSNAAAHAVTAIPHPFYYAQTRQVEGDSTSLTRSETAVHVDAMWVLAAARKLQLTLFGGPTLFQVSQPIVTNITYTESYPYDAATFGSTATEEQNASKIGFNAGADLSYMFTRQVGLGGGIRYSSATVPFRGPDGKTVSVKAGGPQVALGVRFRF